MVVRRYTKFDMRTRSFIETVKTMKITDQGFTTAEHITLWTDPKRTKRMHEQEDPHAI